MEAIGFLELNSIARGIEAADRILKTADTRLLYAKAAARQIHGALLRGGGGGDVVSGSRKADRRTFCGGFGGDSGGCTRR